MSECKRKGGSVEFVAYVESKSIARSVEQYAHVQKVLYALYNLFSKNPQNFAGEMQNN